MGCNCKQRYSGGRLPKYTPKPKDTSKSSVKIKSEKENKNVQD